MSTEAVKKFWQKAQHDKALQAKLAAIEAKHRQATVADIVKLAAEAGFTFTAAEYDAAVKETLVKEHAAGELTEEQLANLAGGRMIPSNGCTAVCGSEATACAAGDCRMQAGR